MLRFTFQPIFDSYWLIAGLISLLLALLWVRPLFPSADVQRRHKLTWLRVAVIGLLALAMLRPALVTVDNQSKSATIVMLTDVSRSMNVPDAGNQTRWHAARQTLSAIAPQLESLSEKYKIASYLFDSRATNVPADAELPDTASGDESDIGTALDDVLRTEAGQRIAAVFLLTDGAQRAVNPRVEIQQPVRELARRGVPLYTTGYGESRDKSQSRDVAVENLPDQYTVFVNNQLEVRAAIRVQGLAGREIPVQLDVEAPDGSSDQVGPITILADEQNQQLQVQLSYTPLQVGQYKLTLLAQPQPGEQVTDNNQLTAFVNVLDGGLRVLYIDGNVGWQERKFIRRALDESPDIQVDLWLDTRTDRNLSLSIPFDENEPYDVYLIGDISAQLLSDETALLIANAVADGKGLMMLGGVNSFGPGGYARSPLGKALPVTMSRLAKQAENEPIRQDVHLQGEQQMLPTMDHFVTRLAAAGENSDRWAGLPPLLGANRFRQLGEQAVLLAESSDKHPLLVSGNFGLGRVLAMAGDSTYRWYRRGFQDEHKRFWRQCMLWLAHKEDAQQNEVWLRMLQRRFRPGSRVPITLGARDSAGETITDAEFALTLQGPGGYSATVRVTKEADGKSLTWSATSEPLTAPGDYEFQLVATRNGEKIGTDQGDFLILDQDIELADPAANPQQLKSLAELTAVAGGRFLAPEQMSSVLQELVDVPLETEIEFQSKWQLADSSGDASLFFMALIALLLTEWYLRKKWGMV